MAQEKTKEEKNFDWLERTIEGLLNDFEGGITEKEETMNQFFELIFGKLVAEIQELRDKLSSQLEPQVMQLLADITENKLLVRPSLVGGWWVSKWKGVTGLNEAYCNGVIGEGKTILEAVNEWKKLSKQSA
jgi:hypothetical protein